MNCHWILSPDSEKTPTFNATKVVQALRALDEQVAAAEHPASTWPAHFETTPDERNDGNDFWCDQVTPSLITVKDPLGVSHPFSSWGNALRYIFAVRNTEW